MFFLLRALGVKFDTCRRANIPDLQLLALSWDALCVAASPLRILLSSFSFKECMGATTSEATLALVNEKDAVVELAPKPGGGWVETVHYLD